MTNQIPEIMTEQLSLCNRCGYCMAHCPTYRTIQDERHLARGRNEVVREAVENLLEFSPQERDALFSCLLCGACTDGCFTSVKTSDIMIAARERWHELHGRPAIQRYLFNELLPYPRRMNSFLRTLSLGQRSGLPELARSMGLLRWLHPSLDAATALSGKMPRRFLRDVLPALGFKPHASGMICSPSGQRRKRVLFFIGCGTNYQAPRQGEAAIRLLLEAGCEVVVADNVCCGLPPMTYGDRAATLQLIKQNIDLINQFDVDEIVTECGSCSSFLYEWPQINGVSSGADEIAQRVVDFTQFADNLGITPTQATGQIVTYHDPCHLSRKLGIREEPRRLLRDVAGVEFQEMSDANLCCGGAGSYNLTHPEISQSILSLKMENVAKTGAQILATSCPACVIQLNYGVETCLPQVQVQHVAEVIAQAKNIKLLSG